MEELADLANKLSQDAHDLHPSKDLIEKFLLDLKNIRKTLLTS